MDVKKHLGVVLKTVERCNINCSYCYMFNMGDDTYLNRPIYIKKSTIHAIADFLKEGCIALGVAHLVLELHGGEPLMQDKQKFDEMCSYFESTLKDYVELEIVMQTNAMLLDDDWLRLARKYHIGIGTSIDGPKEYHDKYRVDKRGRGTYDRVVEKLLYAQQSEIMKGFPHKIGVLCVINPHFDARKIYRHFVDDLHLTYFDFLTPYCTHHHQLDYTAKQYGKFLCDLFDEWARDNNPKIEIRFLRSVLNNFFGKNSLIYGVGPANINDMHLFSITTAGELTPTDEMRAINNSISYSGSTVFNTSLEKFFQAEIFKKIKYAQTHLPETCTHCCWSKVCAGGAIVNRFHESNYFDNPSIFCEGLKMLYRNIANYLIDNEYKVEEIANLLEIKSSENVQAVA